jgi:hypothetical protein
LCIDLGSMEPDKCAAEPLFQEKKQRRDRVQRAVRWTKTLTDPRLRAAIVDRLTFGGNITETGTDSARPRPRAPARRHLSPP